MTVLVASTAQGSEAGLMPGRTVPSAAQFAMACAESGLRVWLESCGLQSGNIQQ